MVVVNGQGVSGTVTLSQVSPAYPTVIRANLIVFDGSINALQIYSLPPSNMFDCSDVGSVYDPYGAGTQCSSPTTTGCAVGNLNGRQPNLGSNLASQTFIDVEVIDSNVPLFGSNSIVNRALYFGRVAPGLPFCLPISLDGPVRTRQFAVGAPYNAGVTLQQDLYNSSADTSVALAINVDKSFNSSFPFSWFFANSSPASSSPEACSLSSLTVFDPLNVSSNPHYTSMCNSQTPWNCAIGDESGKFGTLALSLHGRSLVTDPMLPLSGSLSVANKESLVFSNTKQVACGALASPPRVAIAYIQNNYVAGSVTFSQASPWDVVNVHLELYPYTSMAILSLQGAYIFIYSGKAGIYSSACSSIGNVFDPDGRGSCDPSVPQNCRVGDISARLGVSIPIQPASGSTFTLSFSDSRTTLFGQQSIIGHSIVLTPSVSNTPFVCAPISYKGPTTVARAIFTYPVAGVITFTQLAGDEFAETFISVDLVHVDGVSTTSNHSWMIHQNPSSCSCDSAGGVFSQPYIAPAFKNGTVSSNTCSWSNVSDCQVGNVQARLGPLLVRGLHGSSGKQSFVDAMLPLDGPLSIINKSVVVYSDASTDSLRYACSTISIVSPKTATAQLDGGTFWGKVTLSQNSVNDLTKVDLQVSSLTASPSFPWTYAITGNPSQLGQLANGSWAPSCSALGGILNPTGASTCDVNLFKTSYDLCAVGDLSGKYGLLTAANVKRTVYDNFLSLFGSNSVIGRGVSLSDPNNVGTCATLMEAGSSSARAVFTNDVVGEVVFTQALADTNIYALLNFAGSSSTTDWFITSSNTCLGANVSASLTVNDFTGSIYNPFGVNTSSSVYNCGPLASYGCAVGDLQARLGALSSGTPAFFSDALLNINGGLSSSFSSCTPSSCTSKSPFAISLNSIVGNYLAIRLGSVTYCALIHSTTATAQTDIDANPGRGIAITNLDAQYGQWQSKSWVSPTWTNISGSTLNTENALVLSDNPGNFIRFVPQPGYSGNFNCTSCPQPHPHMSCTPCSPNMSLGTLTFVSWDQTDWSPDDSFANATYAGPRGAYSSASKAVSMSLVPNMVNDSSPSGTEYVLYFSVEDNAGNFAFANRTITIMDTIAPQLQLRGPSFMTVEANTMYIDDGATAYDLRDGDVTYKIAVSSVTLTANTTFSPPPLWESVLNCTANSSSVYDGIPYLLSLSPDMAMPTTVSTFDGGRVLACSDQRSDHRSGCVIIDNNTLYFLQSFVSLIHSVNLSDAKVSANISFAEALWPFSILRSFYSATPYCLSERETLRCFEPDDLHVAIPPQGVTQYNMLCGAVGQKIAECKQ